MPKWIRVNTNDESTFPTVNGYYVCKTNYHNVRDYHICVYSVIGHMFFDKASILHPDQFQLEWLDESNDEQVFTLGDMKEAFRCGYSRGSELATLGVQGEYFPEFIKRNYNIDL